MGCSEFLFGGGRMSLMFSIHLISGWEGNCCVYILFKVFQKKIQKGFALALNKDGMKEGFTWVVVVVLRE